MGWRRIIEEEEAEWPKKGQLHRGYLWSLLLGHYHSLCWTGFILGLGGGGGAAEPTVVALIVGLGAPYVGLGVAAGPPGVR